AIEVHAVQQLVYGSKGNPSVDGAGTELARFTTGRRDDGPDDFTWLARCFRGARRRPDCRAAVLDARRSLRSRAGDSVVDGRLGIPGLAHAALGSRQVEAAQTEARGQRGGRQPTGRLNPSAAQPASRSTSSG